MKSLVFLGLLALAWATTIKKPVFPTEEPLYSEELQYKQKTVWQLFQYLYQPTYFPEYENIGLTYSFEENIEKYTTPKYVYEFFKNYPTGSLPKGQVFSIFYDKHQQEAIAFFRVLYSAVDFETFYKTAVWGRIHLNEGLYIYALSVALVHRPDTWRIELPPIYEIYPFYFYNFNVFKLAEEKTGYYFGNFQKSLKYQYYFGKYLQKQYSYEEYPYGQYPYQQYPYQYEKVHPRISLLQSKMPWWLKYEQSNPYQYLEPQLPLLYPPKTASLFPWWMKTGQSPYLYGQIPLKYEEFQKTPLYNSERPASLFPWWMRTGQSPYLYGQYPQKYEEFQKTPLYNSERPASLFPWWMRTGQSPYLYGQYPQKYEKFTPYNPEYYQKYGPQYQSWFQYGPQMEEKYTKLPWFSFQKYGKSLPLSQVSIPPYSQEYMQKYEQYPSWIQNGPQFEEYQKISKFPWFAYEKYQKPLPSSIPPYSQEYMQKYKYPSLYQYGPQIEQYQKLSKLPWFSFEKYQKPLNQEYLEKYPYMPRVPYMEKQFETEYRPYSPEYMSYPYLYQKYPQYMEQQRMSPYLYQKYMGLKPESQQYPTFRPYSEQYFQKYQQYPYFQMTKQFNKPMPFMKYPYFHTYGISEVSQKPVYKYPPYNTYGISEVSQKPVYPPFNTYGISEVSQKPVYPPFNTYGISEVSQKPVYPPFNTYGISEVSQKPVYKYSPYDTYGISDVLEKLPFWQRPKVPQVPPVPQVPLVPEHIQEEREKIPLDYYEQGILITANYSNYFHPEYQMSYFTEDIGMNSFYYYYHIYFPFWMKNEEIAFNTERRGEQFYYIYQQLLARYNLERISNGLEETPLLEYDIPTGFRTEMMYPNGMPFPQRPDHAPIENVYYQGPSYYDNDTLSLMNIKLYEKRLLDAIDSGFVLTRDGRMISIFEPKGFEILGNLIQANPESPNVRYYGPILVFARYLLGYSNYPLDQYHINPSVMEQYETSLHDPAFYQLYKRIVYFFQRYKQYLPRYSEEELLLPGVTIQDVKVDKLVTYFDYFYTDISNIMHSDGPMENIPVHVRQYRLNHKPFNYYMNVMSEKPYEAVIRVFLGPKYTLNGQPIDINKDRLNFVELDKFHYTLVPGLNTIERNSREFYGYVPERTTYKELFMQLVSFQTPIEYTPMIQWGRPQRLMLPKGTQEGQEYQMYFLITPYQSVEKMMPKSYFISKPHLYWDRVLDTLPYGYPFDRPIDESVFYVPNSYFKDVVIYNEFTPEFTTEYPYMKNIQY